MLRKTLSIAVILTALITSGCTTTEYIYSDVELSYPVRRALPVVPSAELSCLSDETFRALVLRETILKTRVRLLERIIDSTKEPVE